MYTNPFGTGNVLHPGTGSAPIPTFPQALSNTVQGRPFTGGGGVRRTRSAAFGYPIIVGAVPGYYGDYGAGYYGDAGYPPQQQQPPVNVTVVNQQPPTPTVIINQNYGPQAAPPDTDTGDAHVFQAPSGGSASYAQPPDSGQQKYALIAFKDHSVYSAAAYWIDGNTMHYVTPQGTQNQASLDLVDLELTKKLNQK